MKLSVIIPVYNTNEIYLRKMLDSLVKQTERPYEVIIVDDGSDQNTAGILEEYKKYGFQVVRHPYNMGIIMSKKTGVAYANGDQIWFADSDDELAPDAVETLGKIAEKYDDDVIWFTTFFREVGSNAELNNDLNTQKPFRPLSVRMDSKEALSFLFERYDTWNVLWSKMFSAKVVKKAYSEIADEYAFMAEDEYATFMILYYASSFRGVDTPALYFYNHGAGTTSYDSLDIEKYKKYLKASNICIWVKSFLEKEGTYTEYKRYYHGLCKKIFNDCKYNLMSMSPDNWNEGIKLFKNAFEGRSFDDNEASRMFSLIEETGESEMQVKFSRKEKKLTCNYMKDMTGDIPGEYVAEFNNGINVLNGYDLDGARRLAYGGISFGPYMDAPAGRYYVHLEGRLLHSCVFRAYSGKGKTEYRINKTLKNRFPGGSMDMYFDVPEVTDDLEFVIKNKDTDKEHEVLISELRIARHRQFEMGNIIAGTLKEIANISLESKNVRIRTFGDGKDMRGGYDREGIRYIPRFAVSFGPYWVVGPGTYVLLIEGENLDKSDIRVCYCYGHADIKQYIVEYDSKRQVSVFTISRLMINLEVNFQNFSDATIAVKDFKLAKLMI